MSTHNPYAPDPSDDFMMAFVKRMWFNAYEAEMSARARALYAALVYFRSPVRWPESDYAPLAELAEWRKRERKTREQGGYLQFNVVHNVNVAGICLN